MSELGMPMLVQPTAHMLGQIVYFDDRAQHQLIVGKIGHGRASRLSSWVTFAEQAMPSVPLATVVAIPVLVQAFVAAVGPLPHVQKVLVDDLRHVQRIVTLISAPAFELSPRTLVYEAQLAALAAADYPVVDFRLINTQELSDDTDTTLPASYQLVFQRQ